MTGTLAQIITLTAYGNKYLKNGKIPADFDSNTTFQFCKTIDFREFKTQPVAEHPEEHMVAFKPSEWFGYLKNDGCKYLRLYFQSSADQTLAKDHKLAGMVGGGGLWLIEAVYNNYSNFWANRWLVADQKAADNKIWAVNYGRTAEKQLTIDTQIDNEDVKTRLDKTLTGIADFANNQNLDDWAQTFERAQSVLNNAAPEEQYYHKDLIPVIRLLQSRFYLQPALPGCLEGWAPGTIWVSPPKKLMKPTTGSRPSYMQLSTRPS